MTSKLRTLLHTVRMFLPMLLYLPAVVLAQSYAVQNPLGQNATLCGLIKDVLNAAMLIGVPIAVLLIVYAGFKFVAARGSAEDLTRARTNFFYTIIGILIFFGAGAIADVIIGTLQAVGVSGVSSC